MKPNIFEGFSKETIKFLMTSQGITTRHGMTSTGRTTVTMSWHQRKIS